MPVTDQVACTARSFDVPSVCQHLSDQVAHRQHRLIGPPALWLQTLADPRHRRGKRHSFVSVLLIACSAVLTGARSIAAIGLWARSAPQDALARLGTCAATVFDVRIAPGAATIRRVLNAACPGGLADLLGCDPGGAETLAVDGNSARGPAAVGPARHLLRRTAMARPACGSHGARLLAGHRGVSLPVVRGGPRGSRGHDPKCRTDARSSGRGRGLRPAGGRGRSGVPRRRVIDSHGAGTDVDPDAS